MVLTPGDPAGDVASRGGLIPRRLVVALVGLCLLVAAAVVWALFGRAPETVRGEGVILPIGGYTELGTDVTGVVRSVRIAPGDLVRAGEPLIEVAESDTGRKRIVSAPATGVVVDVRARSGRITRPGEPLALLDPSDHLLRLAAFPPSTAAAGIVPGMTAYVSPSDAPAAQYGYIEGRVVSVAPASVTLERVLTLVGDNRDLAEYFLKGEPVTEVTVEMTPGDTPSGYTWTIGSGPDASIDGGTLSTALIVTREGKVIDWMVP